MNCLPPAGCPRDRQNLYRVGGEQNNVSKADGWSKTVAKELRPKIQGVYGEYLKVHRPVLVKNLGRNALHKAFDNAGHGEVAVRCLTLFPGHWPKSRHHAFTDNNFKICSQQCHQSKKARFTKQGEPAPSRDVGLVLLLWVNQRAFRELFWPPWSVCFQWTVFVSWRSSSTKPSAVDLIERWRKRMCTSQGFLPVFLILLGTNTGRHDRPPGNPWCTNR